MTLHRRLVRLEALNGRYSFAHLSDSELDLRMRAVLTEWLRADPDACPADVQVDVSTFVAEPTSAGGKQP